MRKLPLVLLGLSLLASCTRPANMPKAQSVATITAPTSAQPRAATAGADGLGDTLFPKLGNGGYDVQRYFIDIDVDVAKNVISATTTIEAQATQDLSQFNLDLTGLNVRAVLVDGTAARFSRNGQELKIQPAQAIANQAKFSASIQYDGSPKGVDDPSVDFSQIGWLRESGGIYVVSEPSGAMSWYPNNNHPLDKATYTIKVTVPQGYVVAANGSLQQTQQEANGQQTYTWISRDPIASYLVTVHINDFETETQSGPHGLPIRNYFPTGTNQSVKRKFAKTTEMIQFMEKRIGPYPFEAYGAVLVTAPIDFALETQTLSTFSQNGADETTVFHELMHQWFGNSVSPASWRDVWLNEGFATYFQFLWGTRNQGDDALRAAMDNWYDWLQDNRSGTPIPNTPRQMFSGGVYYRGAYTLHALHMTFGDDAFYKILRAYYEQHRYGNASTEDFIATAERIAGPSARTLLKAWLYDPDLPPKV